MNIESLQDDNLAFKQYFSVSDLKNANSSHSFSEKIISPGNIIPNSWYKEFTNKRGTPDTALISILSEIVYWHRPKIVKNINGNISYSKKFKGDAWQTSYAHFKDKFNFYHEKVRRILIKLEEIGVIVREFRTVKINGQIYPNRLFIKLSNDFLNSLFEKDDIKKKDNITCNNEDDNSNFDHQNNDIVKNQNIGLHNFEVGSPQNEGDYIISNNKNIKKELDNRSIDLKSNFFSNFSKKIEFNIDFKEQAKVNIDSKPKKLCDFYPLNLEDCKELQELSGRRFNLKGMNEILRNMLERTKYRYFYSKKQFISYMSKAYKNELREEEVVNNEGFILNQGEENNIEPNNFVEKQILKNVELLDDPNDIDNKIHKRIIKEFKREKAFQIINIYKKIEKEEGKKYKLKLRKDIELSDCEVKKILLIINEEYKKIEEDYIEIKNIEIFVISKSLTGEIKEKLKYSNKIYPDNIWGKIRKDITRIYGHFVDSRFFENIENIIDNEEKIIKLKTRTEFEKDMIISEYHQNMEIICNKYKYKLNII